MEAITTMCDFLLELQKGRIKNIICSKDLVKIDFETGLRYVLKIVNQQLLVLQYEYMRKSGKTHVYTNSGSQSPCGAQRGSLTENMGEMLALYLRILLFKIHMLSKLYLTNINDPTALMNIFFVTSILELRQYGWTQKINSF